MEQEGGGSPGKGKQAGLVDGLAVDGEEKMDSLQLEYTYLLTSQLEDQRGYFQAKLARVEEEAGREVAAVQERLQEQGEARARLVGELEVVAREKARGEARAQQLGTRVAKLATELEEEKQLNRSLRDNQGEWQTRLKRAEVEVAVMKQKKDSEIQELKEQVLHLH